MDKTDYLYNLFTYVCVWGNKLESNNAQCEYLHDSCP